MAVAAANFISWVIYTAYTSKVPLKIPGKAKLLFTWFLKSDLPVP